MKEPYREGIASHSGPESCAAIREGGGEALTGVRAGRTSSREILTRVQGADVVRLGGRQHRAHRNREMCSDPARSKTPGMHRVLSFGNREIPWLAAEDSAVVRVANPQGARRR